MSEEKPVFKITDRRLFNADGTPREGAREEEPAAPEPATAPSAAAGDVPAARPAEAGGREASGAQASVAPEARDEARAAREPESRGASTAASAEGHEEPADPQGFMMVVEFVASFAADALGLVDHPGAGGREVNPPLARQCIEMLATLQHKTRNNLNADEQHFLDMVLSQLRMQYVALTTSRPGRPGGGPRGFSGGDITGGI